MDKQKCYMEDIRIAMSSSDNFAWAKAVQVGVDHYTRAIVAAFNGMPRADVPLMVAALKIASDLLYESLPEHGKGVVNGCKRLLGAELFHN